MKLKNLLPNIKWKEYKNIENNGISNKKQATKYDVCIVGSGAGGGMAAKVLADAGFKVAMLEADPDFDPANDEQRTQLRWPPKGRFKNPAIIPPTYVLIE